MILVRLSNKIVGLDLAPFSEKVENHWFTTIVVVRVDVMSFYFINFSSVMDRTWCTHQIGCTLGP